MKRKPLKRKHGKRKTTKTTSVELRRLGTEGAKYGLKLWNKTIKTYENVSQFWTWPEADFLAHPSIWIASPHSQLPASSMLKTPRWPPR